MAFEGTWKYDRAENFAALLDAVGAPEPLRKGLADGASPSLVFSRDGDFYVSKMVTKMGDIVTKFKIGEPYEQNDGLFSGKSRQAVVTVEGSKMVIKGTGSEKMDKVVVTREVVGGELVNTISFEGVTATTYYKKE